MVALAIYTRSPAAYEALKGFDILQLPSVLACVLDTVKLVCDGRAANLTAIKAARGECGAYSILDDVTTDRFEVKPWFRNPFCPPELIFWICPLHQVQYDIL